MDSNHDTLRNINCVITDCDGILTDGKIYITDRGEQLKAFHAHDGAGIKLLQQAGFLVTLVSGRESPPLANRAEELDIEEFFPGSHNKIEPFRQMKSEYELTSDEICYIGDDLTDLSPFIEAGFSATVPDAAEEIRNRADYVTETRGGNGAFREVSELILKTQDKREAALEGYK